MSNAHQVYVNWSPRIAGYRSRDRGDPLTSYSFSMILSDMPSEILWILKLCDHWKIVDSEKHSIFSGRINRFNFWISFESFFEEKNYVFHKWYKILNNVEVYFLLSTYMLNLLLYWSNWCTFKIKVEVIPYLWNCSQMLITFFSVGQPNRYLWFVSTEWGLFELRIRSSNVITFECQSILSVFNEAVCNRVEWDFGWNLEYLKTFSIISHFTSVKSDLNFLKLPRKIFWSLHKTRREELIKLQQEVLNLKSLKKNSIFFKLYQILFCSIKFSKIDWFRVSKLCTEKCCLFWDGVIILKRRLCHK